jgi:hypothetical protein
MTSVSHGRPRGKPAVLSNRHHFGIKEVLRASLVDSQELLPGAKVTFKAEAQRDLIG